MTLNTAFPDLYDRAKDVLSELTLLDAAIIEQTEKDLYSTSPRLVYQAAVYLFPDGRGVDEDDSKTFIALCQRHGINPDQAAKAIWNRLPKRRQKRITHLLKEAGYTTVCP